MQHTDLFTEEEPPETEDPPEISFGEQLAKARKSAGIERQEDLAEKVGCTRGHIALIEQNRGRPGKSLYGKLVELFGEFLEPPTETRSKNILAVEIEEGSWISKDTAIDTFIEVIKKIGIEKVKNLGKYEAKVPLVANNEDPNKAQKTVETETGTTYYIFSGLAITRMKRILDDIADRLNLKMRVFINQAKKK